MFRIIHLPTAEYVVSGLSSNKDSGVIFLSFDTKVEADQFIDNAIFKHFTSNWFTGYWAESINRFTIINRSSFGKYLFDIVEVDDV